MNEVSYYKMKAYHRKQWAYAILQVQIWALVIEQEPYEKKLYGPNHHIRQQRKSQLLEHSTVMPSKMAKVAGNYKYTGPRIALFMCPNQCLSFCSDCCRWKWTSVLEPNQGSVKGIFNVSESLTVSEFNDKGQDSLKRQR